MSLREQIQEIVEIIKIVPEEFRSKTFELLLNEAIANQRNARPPSPQRKDEGEETKKPKSEIQDPLEPEKKLEAKVVSQADIGLNDLHVKTRRFMERYQISIEEVNNLFYKEGTSFQPLIEDYGSTKMSETQVRVALFQSLGNALSSGEFVTTVETVRTECKDRKAYDMTNFTAILKKNAALFDFGEFSKDVEELRLSEDGRRELATVIKSLA